MSTNSDILHNNVRMLAAACCIPKAFFHYTHRLHSPNNANQLPTSPTTTTLRTLMLKQGIRHTCLYCNIHHSPFKSPPQEEGVSHCFHSSMWHPMQCIACLIMILILPSLSRKVFTTVEVWEEPTQLSPTHSRSC